MKPFALLLVLFGLFSAATAQTGHSPTTDETAAARAASLDDGIVTRVNPQTGAVRYLRKNVDAETGMISYAEVEFCSRSGRFVHVSPGKSGACIKSAAGSETGLAEAEPGPEKEESTLSAAQRAACSGAYAKPKPAPPRKSSATVKLVSNR